MNKRPPIGSRIRDAMERKRMDQNQLARVLGVSRSAVNAWINDRTYPQNSMGALEEVLHPYFRRPDSAGPAFRTIPPQTKRILAAALPDGDDYERVIALLEGRADGDRGEQAL